MSISRLALGMTQAAMYPSIHTLLAKWAPLRERGRLSTYIYTGRYTISMDEHELIDGDCTNTNPC